jgi:glyoxylase-like metal-dependent hydrolase (beta-lactamase superfamily II)
VDQQSEGYVSSRRVGDATVTIINEGSIGWNPNFNVPEAAWRPAMPDADEAGRIRLGLNLAHVRLGDASILIDPGLDDPGTAWSEHFEGRFHATTRTPGLASGLAAIGVHPDEITHVLITHAHADHIAGLTVERDGEVGLRFPNARVYVGRADWEDSPDRSRPDSELMRRLAPIERLGRLELVASEREIVPGVTMYPAPGETPGACVVRIDSGGDRFFYVGDLFHHACEASNPEWVSPGRDQAAMTASRRRVIDEALPTNATVVFTHRLFPPWGHLTQIGDTVRWVPD